MSSRYLHSSDRKVIQMYYLKILPHHIPVIPTICIYIYICDIVFPLNSIMPYNVPFQKTPKMNSFIYTWPHATRSRHQIRQQLVTQKRLSQGRAHPPLRSGAVHLEVDIPSRDGTSTTASLGTPQNPDELCAGENTGLELINQNPQFLFLVRKD